MDNIILIGMPASGKSTLGVMLAKLLGYDFLDTDLLIQKKAGRHLQDILDSDGIAAFKQLEEEALLSIDCRRTVIATGGSAVYSARGMKHLSSLGKTVYLYIPYSLVKVRLKNLAERGVVMEKGSSLRELFSERESLYERYADITFDETERGRTRSMAKNATLLYRLLTDAPSSAGKESYGTNQNL